MKRFISLILSIIFIFSAFSITAFASSEAPLRNKINFENGISARVISSDDNAQVEETLFFKNNKLAVDIPVSVFKVKIIFNDDTVYIYFPAFPFFYIKEENVEIPDMDNIFSSQENDFKFLYTHQQNIDGITYDVDVYESDNYSFIEYYYIDNNLKFVKSVSETDDELTTLKIEILSTNVDDKVFKLPFFSFDISPFLEYITLF